MLLICFIFSEVKSLTGKATPIVKFFRWQIAAHTVLADEADTIARFLQEQRVRLGQCLGGEIGGEIVDAMTSGILTTQDTGPAYRTDGRRHKGIAEKNTFLSQPIDVRGLDDGVAHTTQSICPQIIGNYDHNIGWR
jgi:hypothetical protein